MFALTQIDFEEKQDHEFEVEETNASKLMSLANDDHLISHLYQKMRMEVHSKIIQGNLDHYPILKVYSEELTASSNPSETNTFDYNCLYQL